MRAFNYLALASSTLLLIASILNWGSTIYAGDTATSTLWCAAVLVFLRECREGAEELWGK